MSQPRGHRPQGTGAEPDEAMVGFGRTAAAGLQLQHGGNTVDDTGWRCALQRAADHSLQEREILQIADDVYGASAALGDATRLLAYVSGEQLIVTSQPAASFLLGMLDRIDDHPDGRRRP